MPITEEKTRARKKLRIVATVSWRVEKQKKTVENHDYLVTCDASLSESDVFRHEHAHLRSTIPADAKEPNITMRVTGP